MRRNEGIHHLVHIPACQIMRFQLVDGHIQSRLVRLDERQDDLPRRNAAHAHSHKCHDAHMDIGRHRGNPKPHRNKVQEHHDKDYQQYQKETRAEQLQHQTATFLTTTRLP